MFEALYDVVTVCVGIVVTISVLFLIVLLVVIFSDMKEGEEDEEAHSDDCLPNASSCGVGESEEVWVDDGK